MSFKNVILVIVLAFSSLMVKARLLVHEQILNSKICVNEDAFVKYTIINIGFKECTNVTLTIAYNESQIQTHRKSSTILFEKIVNYSNVSHVLCFIPKNITGIELEARIEYTYQNSKKHGYVLRNQALIATNCKDSKRQKLLNTSVLIPFFAGYSLVFAVPQIILYFTKT